MAYCVHCGVKLAAGEKHCPLCQTVSVDPNELEVRPVKRYPVRTPEQNLQLSKRYLLVLFGLIFLGPALLCLLIDYLLSGSFNWSIYPFGALLLLYITVAVPILVQRYRALLSLMTGFITLSAYLYLVEIVSRSGDWFFPMVLPSMAIGVGLSALLVWLSQKKILRKLTFLSGLIAAASVECLAVEYFCSLHHVGYAVFLWSPYVLAPCLFAALVLIIINSNRKLREEVRRRVYF